MPRTSIDLELDLQAQHTRLLSLRDEITRLRNLKSRLEAAKEEGNVEIAAWVLEDAQFQHLVSQVSRRMGKHPPVRSTELDALRNDCFALSQADSKTEDDKKIEKLLKKTSREIYRLRKSKAGSGKPDVISFK